jgi:enamine deaminase RidA (YjgF/YER057c/UK114 family)
MTIKKQVERYGPMAQFIPEGVRSGDLLTLSGQVALDNAGAMVGEGDIAAQVVQAYSNVQEVLRRFDATMDNIVDEMWLVTDIQNVMANIRTLWPLRAEAYGVADPEVSQTLVQVSGLAMPGLLIEIKCIARV